MGWERLLNDDYECPARKSIYNPSMKGEGLEDQTKNFIELFRAIIAKPYDNAVVVREVYEYCAEIWWSLLPTTLFACLALLVLLPLWISRCRAHRCCPPPTGGLSESATRKWRGEHAVRLYCGPVAGLARVL